MHSRPHRLVVRNGLTLVESLISIGIVTVLASILLIAVVGARTHTQDIKALSDLKQHVAVFDMYSADHADAFPQLVPALPIRHEISNASGLRAYDLAYFETIRFWNIGLSDQYYDGDAQGQSFYSPTRVANGPGQGGTSYMHSQALLAGSDFWNTSTRLSGHSQWRAVRQAEVVSPSKKGIFLDYEGFMFPSVSSTSLMGVAIGFADGSARFIKVGELLPPYPRASGGPPGDDATLPIPVLHTVDGVRGRDVQ